MVPLARLTGNALSPDRKLLSRLFTLVHSVSKNDRQRILVKLLQNLVQPESGQDGYLLGLYAHLVTQLARTKPGGSGPLTPADIKSIMGSVTSFLTDRKHGMERFYDVVKGRKGAAGAPSR